MSWYNDLISLEGCRVQVVFDNGNQVIGCIDKKGMIQIDDNKIFPFVVDNEGTRYKNSGIKDVVLIRGKEQDRDEWYRNLSLEGLAGKHVVITGKNIPVIPDTIDCTTIRGRLDDTGSIRFPHSYGFKVFYYLSDHTEKSEGVDSVKLIWDERNYKPIPVKEIRQFDHVVINDRLCTITDMDTEESQGRVQYTALNDSGEKHILSHLPESYGLRPINE